MVNTLTEYVNEEKKMLNEQLEYNQYTFSYYKGKNGIKYRISKRNFDNHLTGLPRALEIIARRELYKKKSSDAISQEEISKVRKVLIHWLNELKKEENLRLIYPDPNKKDDSDKQDNPDNPDDSDKEAKAAKEKYHSTILKAQKDLDQFIIHYKKDSIGLKKTGFIMKANVNDLNVTTWDRSIASALEKGPLREYILVEKKDLFSTVYKSNRGTDRPLSDERAANQKDFLLKLTAYYLLENTLSQKSVTLKELLIYNWARFTGDNSYYFKSSSKKTRDIYIKSPVAGSLNKFSFDPAWIGNYELVDISEKGSLDKWLSDPENNGKTYYSDRGAFEVLEKNICAIINDDRKASL